MKPYKFYTHEENLTEKGIVNDTFLSFIGDADSLFSMFIRSMAYRHRSPEGTFERKYKFVIYDKNPKHIEMFKYMLKWDGKVGTPEDLENLAIYMAQGGKLLGIPTASDYDTRWRIGKLTRRGFTNFTYAWNCFKNSSFEFLEIDVINNNEEFVRFLYNLNNIKMSHRQFVKLDFNKDNYPKEVYDEAINNILHMLWFKSFKEYQSVVILPDENNQLHEDFAGKIYAKRNPTFCILPWMHIQYKPSGQSKLCCRYDNTKENKDYNLFLENPNRESDISELFQERAHNLLIQKTSIEDSFNSKYWKTARELTLQNKPISGCDKCYKEEQVPGEVATSMRLGSSILYNEGYLHKKPKFEKPSIEFLEVGFGNYCNLACLSCNSTLSTTWHDDEVKLNDSGNNKLKRVVFPKLDNLKFEPNEDTLKSLNLIKFTGGEPMINPEFVKFIDLICDKGYPENISLEIYTNCSYIPSPKLLTNLKKFKNIQLNLSIDAYGPTNDYIRYGSVWQGDGKQTVSNSLDFWLAQGVESKNINVIMSSTLSVLNVFDIPELITWWMDKFKDSGNTIIVHRTSTLPTEYEGFFKLQMAFDPSYIGMNILPKEYYSEIVDWANKYLDDFTSKYPDLEFVPESIRASLIKLNNAVDRSKGDPKNAKLFLEYLENMDKIRNNSASESIPKVLSKVKEYLLTQDKLQQN